LSRNVGCHQRKTHRGKAQYARCLCLLLTRRLHEG
jgi:hypothetical protein